MKLFFLKLLWQIMPVALVLILLILLGFAWVYWLKDLWKGGSLKRLLATCISALMVSFCMIVLMGFSSQSKLPFGQKIEAISAEQATVKEQNQLLKKQEERDKELIHELNDAITVANTQRTLLNEVAVETITTDWLASYRTKISELSDLEVREEYTQRFTDIENYFYPD